MGQYIILRREGPPIRHPLWEEIRATMSVNAEEAFKQVVFDYEAKTVHPGEYMILPLEGGWRVGAEIVLRDLSSGDGGTKP